MKIKIWQHDSFHKIYKIIEKIQRNKSVDIEIHENNEIFHNIFWWKQIFDLLVMRHIDFKFICSTDKTLKYFDDLKIQVEKLWFVFWDDKIIFKRQIIKDTLKNVFNFFFTAKDLHGKILKKRSWITYVIISWEIIWLWYIFFFFYSLVSPSAEIFLTPSYNVEEIVYNFRFFEENRKQEFEDSQAISIPYYTGSIQITYPMSIQVQNIKYLQNPAKWTIKIINNSKKWFSLKANTKFITDDWLIFRALWWFNIQPSKDWKPTETFIEVESMEKDDNDKIIWIRWNLNKWTILYIRNLKDSFYLKDLYWIVEKNFWWWNTITEWTVSLSDIDILKNKLKENVEKEKMTLLVKHINDQNSQIISNKNDLESDNRKILLPFDEFINMEIDNVTTNSNPWDKLSDIEWNLKSTISYKYVIWEDMKKWVKKYIQQRQSDNMNLADIDSSSLIFYELNKSKNYYVIPSKIDVIWWYDFIKDINWIKNNIKSNIIWKTKDESINLIKKSYLEVGTVDIKLFPSWYSILPNLKSRINININE